MKYRLEHLCPEKMFVACVQIEFFHGRVGGGWQNEMKTSSQCFMMGKHIPLYRSGTLPL